MLDGHGGVVLLEGAHGSGKTQLLAAARSAGEDAGLQVLHARAGELERGFAWVVVRQLFEHRLTAVDGAVDALLTGPATLAGSIFDYADPEGISAPPHEGAGLYRVLHGLYWLCRNLSATTPLLLLIDDAHHADTASLQFVNYLVNRLERSGVLLVLTSTPDPQGGPAQELLLSASRSPDARHAVLEPLGRGAVREAITARLGDAPHDDVTAACLAASEGNPLHLTELLDEMSRRGISPQQPAAETIPHLAPARMAKEVVRQLHDLPQAAQALADAVAVLGDDAEPRHCAAAAGLSHSEALQAAHVLREAGVLNPGLPYAFRRSVVRPIVYSRMSSETRSQVHRRAAYTLHASGADIVTVAEHLCRTEPGNDPWTVRTLRAAAVEAMRRVEPGDSTRYLRRALADSNAERDPWILGQLGSAELRARQPEAVEHLREALRRTHDPVVRCRLRLELAVALTAAARYDEALRVLAVTGALRDEQDVPDPTDQAARTVAAVVARTTPGHWPTDRLPAVGAPRAHAAIEALSRGLSVTRVARLAAAAVPDDAPLPAEDTELTDTVVAAWALSQCDEAESAERALRETAHRALNAGHLLAAATSASLLGGVLLDTGRLAEAETGARRLLRQHEGHSLMLASVPLAAAVLTHCLIETDRLHEAEEALHRHGLTGRLPRSALFVPLRIARIRLRIRQDRFETGLRELTECRDLADQEGWLYPSASSEYLSDAAKALAITTGPRAARALAADVTERARAFGAPRPLAAALRTYGEIVGGDEGLEMLESAEHLLASSPYLLERARVQVALGAALRRQGRRAAARRRLTAGMDTAQRIGASVLEATARSELRLAGVRQARGGPQQRAPLTPAEERVAHKAAAGLSNREISQALFVTVKTVEWHLSQAYAKLGIAKRAELGRALAAGPASQADEMWASA
ncbi:helix-turn-helix transcriptional regulator [Streptomyces flavalbus]|uniref:AAA family ATPase n=1 Tax=Streptomyces flavalbus TaxID=2665155 RepID=A0ABW2WLX7_9ACTN